MNKTSANGPRSGGCIQTPASGGSGRTQKHPLQKKKITCTVFENWRVKGFKTSKALQIAINTLNYPASLKAFMLLFFPTKEQAPDCGCLERNIQEGVEPGGRRGGEGREGSKRLGCPGRLSPAGWQETAGNCVGLLLSEGCVPKARCGTPGSWRQSPLLVKMGERNSRAAMAA